jgi:hypothetical protein
VARLSHYNLRFRRVHVLNTPVSTGFATVHGNNTLTINAVEAYPLDKFTTEVSARRRVHCT